jgi:hypothetical protein
VRARPPRALTMRRGTCGVPLAPKDRYPRESEIGGATYGAFPAACHYDDGTFTPEPTADACAPKSPQSGSAFNFWHPALVTMHVWIWCPNPSGIYASMNPLVPAFN